MLFTKRTVITITSAILLLHIEAMHGLKKRDIYKYLSILHVNKEKILRNKRENSQGIPTLSEKGPKNKVKWRKHHLNLISLLQPYLL